MKFLIIWYALVIIQVFLGYGTAYRLTKTGGDNGITLFGWILVQSLASLIPGLGIYLWYKYKDLKNNSPYPGSTYPPDMEEYSDSDDVDRDN